MCFCVAQLLSNIAVITETCVHHVLNLRSMNQLIYNTHNEKKLKLCQCARNRGGEGKEVNLPSKGGEGQSGRAPITGHAPMQLLSNCLTTKMQQHKNTTRKKCINCDQLILWKISKIGATRCQILRLKCTKFDFRGSLQRSPRGAYSAPPGELTTLPQNP